MCLPVVCQGGTTSQALTDTLLIMRLNGPPDLIMLGSLTSRSAGSGYHECWRSCETSVWDGDTALHATLLFTVQVANGFHSIQGYKSDGPL